jgi:hypothetical protein
MGSFLPSAGWMVLHSPVLSVGPTIRSSEILSSVYSCNHFALCCTLTITLSTDHFVSTCDMQSYDRPFGGMRVFALSCAVAVAMENFGVLLYARLLLIHTF